MKRLKNKLRMNRGHKAMPQPALVHSCPSCKMIFRVSDRAVSPSCPGCGEEITKTAHSVYGKAAYGYELSQIPWKSEQIRIFAHDLNTMIGG